MATTPPPPSRSTGRYDWWDITRRLKAKPGEWMLVLEAQPRTVADAIRRKRMSALDDPEWEFELTTRNNNEQDKTCDYWMAAHRKETR